MSAPGPSAIPTSADPRSRRPTKKRALSPTSAQAASVEALFAKPDQDIRIPSLSADAAKRFRRAPPEIVTNVQGSSAGAGSGEFHVYKASRRREYERLRAMDEELKQEKDQEAFERERAEKLKRDEEKTRKNREKREKLKAKKAKKGNGNNGGLGAAAGAKTSPHAQKAAASSMVGVDGDGAHGDTSADGDNASSSQSAGQLSSSAAAAVGLVIHDND